ncbi:Hypothetical protein R9X50_00603200 [Acrodontium crateriforme]|uniref:Uncharacterized protein n=1 Tax=Acrodontium crateriforme TaxID=150365 RepID=A0AAQ3R6G8_9PEZI|nr:Hypothetical protein R9X50_00603200 [Acrodontium crateriforme]
MNYEIPRKPVDAQPPQMPPPLQEEIPKEPMVETKGVADIEESRETTKITFAQRHKKLMSFVTVILVILIIGLGAGLGVGKKGRRHTIHYSSSSSGGDSGSGGSSSSSSSSDSGDTCTPPDTMLCETSGDCQVIDQFSQCLTACNGYSYCS